MNLYCTVTTIFEPTASIGSIAKKLGDVGGQLVVAGDKKGPNAFDVDGCEVHFLSLAAQQDGRFPLGKLLPTGHYARKNIAYLYAIAAGATCIYETDDDNAPNNMWRPRQESVENIRRVAGPTSPRWTNVYDYFTKDSIWPRGLPLDAVSAPSPETTSVSEARSPIQQGLVNRSPDVDAVWRLTQDRAFTFDDSPSVLLEPGNWCPFNTQSTWWWPAAYPLLYVPSHCSFRLCDVWKSFVAQRCLWAMGCGVIFHAPEAEQERNEHDLMSDFSDEVPGYLGNRRLAETLDKQALEEGEDGASTNLIRCYEALQRAGFFPPQELGLVRAWVEDVTGSLGNSTATA